MDIVATANITFKRLFAMFETTFDFKFSDKTVGNLLNNQVVFIKAIVIKNKNLKGNENEKKTDCNHYDISGFFLDDFCRMR